MMGQWKAKNTLSNLNFDRSRLSATLEKHDPSNNRKTGANKTGICRGSIK